MVIGGALFLAGTSPAWTQATLATPVDSLLIQPATFLIVPDSVRMLSVDTMQTLEGLQAYSARRSAFIMWANARMLPCLPVSLADTAGWRPTNVTISGFRSPLGFRMPPSYWEERLIRGRDYQTFEWSRPEAKLELSTGIAHGPSHDDTARLVSCRATVSSGEYIVNSWRDRNGMGFFAVPSRVSGPRIVARGLGQNEAQLRSLWTAFATMPAWR